MSDDVIRILDSDLEESIKDNELPEPEQVTDDE